MKRQQQQDDLIVVRNVPPQRLPWLANELQAQRIPYQVDQVGRGQYDLTTTTAATPVLQRVLATTERWDVFNRKPENRNRLDDALGFALSFIALGVVVSQSGMIADVASEVGVNGDIARGVAILAVGVVVTMVWSELFMHHDRRRYMFRESMLALFAVAAAWFILTGLNVDLAGEVQRWMP